MGDDLSWAPVAGPAVYDVVTGDLDGLATAGMAARTSGCVADDSPATSLLIQGAPPLGDGFWYVVRAANCGGAGSYGSEEPPLSPSRDEAIALSGNDCAP